MRLAYAAISERDIDALAKLTDTEWVFDFSRAIGPQKGVYRGHEQIAQFGAATEEAFERFELSPIEFVTGASGQIAPRRGARSRGAAGVGDVGGPLTGARHPDPALSYRPR